MRLAETLDQHIAVFGESGSGKTVLVSSWYGGAQEPSFRRDHQFRIVAEDYGQGTRLHQNYLGMKQSSLPTQTRFAATSYSFTLKPEDGVAAAPSSDFSALRLVWHDYPGEWFSESPTDSDEAARRLDTFHNLMSADVALLLVDGQLLVENAGQEESYLKVLFTNYRRGLEDLGERVRGTVPLESFPRIWIIGLSKADLLPSLDVYGFRDLVIGKAGAEVAALQEHIATLVQAPEAVALGADFVLLSSARFTPGGIDVSHRVGIDLILPIAEMIPFERFIQWRQGGRLSPELARTLLGDAWRMLPLLLDGVPKSKVQRLVTNLKGPARFLGPVIPVALDLMQQWLRQSATQDPESRKRAMEDAQQRGDALRYVLSRFRVALDEAEAAKILLRGDA